VELPERRGGAQREVDAGAHLVKAPAEAQAAADAGRERPEPVEQAGDHDGDDVEDRRTGIAKSAALAATNSSSVVASGIGGDPQRVVPHRAPPHGAVGGEL